MDEALEMSKLSNGVYEYITALGVASAGEMTFMQKLKLSAIALKEQAAAFLASPLGKAAVIGAAIFATVKLVDHFTVSVEESREKLADLKDEFSEIESELETAESELESIAERIDELNAKDTLTFTEQEELENLQAQRRELERIAALRNSEARAKQEEINETFVDTMNKDLSKKDYVVDWNYFQDSNGSQYATPVIDTEQNYIDTQLAQYKRNLDAINQLNEEYADNLDDEYYQNMVSGLAAANDRIEEYLRGKNSEFMTDMEGVSYIDEPNSETDRATNAWLDYINDFQDKMMIAFGEENAKTNALNRLMDNEFSDVTAGLKELGEQGEVTAEHLSDTKYDAFLEKLKELGVITDTSADSLAFIAAGFNTLSTSVGSASSALDVYTSALEGFTNISNSISSVTEALTTVADIQKEVANGFTISLEKALEFAAVYPEILNGATATADGQITLNKEVVNSFISGKEAELKAEIDAKIADLEVQKEVYTAKMEFAKAQLELAKSVGEGEGQITEELAAFRVNSGNAVAQALIQAGINEADSYRLACAAMAQNVEEFNSVAAAVCTDVQGNFNQAAYDAAQAIYLNMQNSQQAIADVAKQAHESAKAIAGMADGSVQGSSDIIGSGTKGGGYSLNSIGVKDGSVYSSKTQGSKGGTSISLGTISTSSSGFTGTEFTYDSQLVALEDFISNLEIDITEYSNAIAQLDGQIATLQALRNTDLNAFETKSTSSGSKSSSSDTTWFKQEYAMHQHLLAMDAENVEDYLAWLNSAYKQAYDEGIISLDDFYKYQEEVYEKAHDQFLDYLNDAEHEISMREYYDGETAAIFKLYRNMITAIENEITTARAAGLDDTDDYIQTLQAKWQSYNASINDIYGAATNEAKSALDELVEYRIDMIDQDVDAEKDALDQKLDNLREFYDKQKELLQSQQDEKDYLEAQSEKQKAVTELRTELDMLESDDSAWAQKRKLELQEELTIARADLKEFEEDHALDIAMEALDNAYDSQESQIQAEIDALEQTINDPEALYNKALADIKNNTGNLYQEMLEYNRRYGTGNDADVKDIYEEAYKALQEYKDVYGEDYEGVILTNATGYTSDAGSWSSEVISGYNSNSGNSGSGSGSSASGGGSSGSKQSNKSDSSTTSSPPSLTEGSYVKVKSGTKWYGDSYGGNGSGVAQSGTIKHVNKSGTHPYNIDGLGWIKKTDIVGYATGTSNATPGLHELFEDGDEYVFTSGDGSRYKMFSGLGNKVLDADSTEFLYNFATDGGGILSKMLENLFSSSFLDNIVPQTQAIQLSTGDIIVQGNADQKTVSAIRREQRAGIDYILKEFSRLSK